MAKIFISYSRVDNENKLVEDFVNRVRRMRRNDTVWWDDELRGGDVWWREILDQIKACDIFVYLLSNESVASPYCRAEYSEARRLQKLILTVQVRGKTVIPEDLGEIQYVDMSAGIRDGEALTNLIAALEKQVGLIPARPRRASWTPETPRPPTPSAEQEREAAPQGENVPLPSVEMPPSARPITQTNPAVAPIKSSPKRGLTGNQIAILVAVIGLLGTLGAALIGLINNNNNSPSVTNLASNTPNFVTLTAETATPSSSPTQTITSTPEPTLTETPTLEIVYIVETLEAQATINQMTQFARDTAAARGTEIAIGTQSAVNGTATATLWTATPTANVTASIEAFYTQRAQTATAQFFIDASATVAAYTDTPTPTTTPSSTPTTTPSSTPTATPSFTPTITPTATLTPLEEALQSAQNFINIENATNADWQPFEQDFDGVTMVLVPAGCFTIGSEDRENDERNGNEICFDTPFWIDKYEVSNAQFANFNGVAARESNWTEPNRPRESITWFEARDFCALRGARLPSEAEWEYAARGPSNWTYPWGEAFIAENAVYSDNSGNQTADVGSRVGGASWVGALDLSGNVWEWTFSTYQPYPYNPDDGREVDSNSTNILRVLRGGSWFNNTPYLRASYRYGNYSDLYGNLIGFRCLIS